jgi:hypothetical protein
VSVSPEPPIPMSIACVKNLQTGQERFYKFAPLNGASIRKE